MTSHDVAGELIDLAEELEPSFDTWRNKVWADMTEDDLSAIRRYLIRNADRECAVFFEGSSVLLMGDQLICYEVTSVNFQDLI